MSKIVTGLRNICIGISPGRAAGGLAESVKVTMSI